MLYKQFLFFKIYKILVNVARRKSFSEKRENVFEGFFNRTLVTKMIIFCNILQKMHYFYYTLHGIFDKACIMENFLTCGHCQHVHIFIFLKFQFKITITKRYIIFFFYFIRQYFVCEFRQKVFMLRKIHYAIRKHIMLVLTL